MGALTYEPEIEGTSSRPAHENLDKIFDEVVHVQNSDDDTFIDDLLAWNGSSAGARPKILVAIDGKEWIIKFRAPQDPKDIGPLEYAYHLMARAAQLNVPEAKLFPSQKGPGYFGVRRFDHAPSKQHMHTMSGLLHADYRLPSLDYETIMKATLVLTKDARECEKLFRLAVFNVLGHNRDDHGKNFSFLMDNQGTWSVSPAYDLTFSSGPGGEHCTTVMGEGRNPTEAHLLKLAEKMGLKKQKVVLILDEVNQAISQWLPFAKEAGVGKRSREMVQKVLAQ
jgi:serine/threonine-protein kinase HipA